jgi:hypothetical protein
VEEHPEALDPGFLLEAESFRNLPPRYHHPRPAKVTKTFFGGYYSSPASSATLNSLQYPSYSSEAVGEMFSEIMLRLSSKESPPSGCSDPLLSPAFSSYMGHAPSKGGADPSVCARKSTKWHLCFSNTWETQVDIRWSSTVVSCSREDRVSLEISICKVEFSRKL